MIFLKKDSNDWKFLNQKNKTKLYKQAFIIFYIVFLCIIQYYSVFFWIELKKQLFFVRQTFNVFDIVYIRGGGLGCESERIDLGRSYVDKNINISLCFFSRSLTYSGKGGVININGGSYSMLINYSMFFCCVCNNWGGAIWFVSSNNYLKMICAHNCSCGSSFYCHFGYIYTSHVSQVEYLSLSLCSHSTSGCFSMELDSGNQKVDNKNSSMNNAINGPGIWIYSPSSFTSSHCSFSNNNASGCICLCFYSSSGTVSMSCANIVHNNSPSWGGVVYAEGEGSRKMIYCIFHNNQNYLFCTYSGSLEVSHSYIYHSSSFSASNAVSTTNNSLTNRITYQVQFFNSHFCNADMPLIYLTPIHTYNKTPMRSFGQTHNEIPYKLYVELIQVFLLIN